MSVKGLTKDYVRDRKNFFQCEFLLQGGFLWPNKAFEHEKIEKQGLTLRVV